MSNEEENPLDEHDNSDIQKEVSSQDSNQALKDEEKPKISKLSKFLTLLLRHQPRALNLDLDDDGWLSCTVEELVELMKDKRGFIDVTREDIEEIVNNDPKSRYEISKDDHIRATYGHSVRLNPLEFPDDLEDLPKYVYYATNNFQLDTMQKFGLIPREKRDRQFLHLSLEIKDAYTVAKHHSRNPKLIRIDVKKAHNFGVKFRKVSPLIVVCDEVPSQFIEEIQLPDELEYLTKLNPERKYERSRRRRGDSGNRYNRSNRDYRGKSKKQYNSRNENNKYKKSSNYRQRPRSRDGQNLENNEYESSTDFGDVDEIKKKAQNKSTIHFETEKDEDVNFN